MQYFSLGLCPSEEDTVQVRSGHNYLPAMRQQANRFLAALKKRWMDLPSGCRFKIQNCPHDFGEYLDVVIEYPDTLTESKLRYVVELGDAVSELKTWYELEEKG